MPPAAAMGVDIANFARAPVNALLANACSAVSAATALASSVFAAATSALTASLAAVNAVSLAILSAIRFKALVPAGPFIVPLAMPA